MQKIDAFPLQWPLGKNRTPSQKRQRSNFKTTLVKSREELTRQLSLLGAKGVVISSNIATYKKGGIEIMYADQRKSLEDPGVAAYYTWNNEQYCVACDKWDTVLDNLHSLAKTIDAIRGIQRWGTGDMVIAAFSGFKALPHEQKQTDAAKVIPMWFEVLGVNQNASEAQIKEAYRRLAMVHHPDRGGSVENFNRIRHAYETAMSLINRQ